MEEERTFEKFHSATPNMIKFPLLIELEKKDPQHIFITSLYVYGNSCTATTTKKKKTEKE
jgi:hypothetical protein